MPDPTGQIRPDSDIWLPPDARRPSLGRDDTLPPAPFVLSLINTPNGYEWPYTVRSMVTGQAVAGQIDCRAAAVAIRDALNGAAARHVLGIPE